MVTYKLEKKRLNEFLDQLKKHYTVLAPVKTDLIRWTKVHDAKDISFENKTYFPAKEFFFHPKITLFRYDGEQINQDVPEIHKYAFFGMRLCDLNSLKKHDLVDGHHEHDPHYLDLRSTAC